ncbi:ALF repeat-containing protein [Streptomyces sp. NPDC023723]|uniref:ALF repeat-containing protein n=1 Tax=Streptomyces sp. NPDC023723 TaxID=3154323 RepID=UPI0033F850B9
MRPNRAALFVAATALTPALLLTAPAFAADASASATTTVSATTPVTPVPATACADIASDALVDAMTEDELRAAIQAVLADDNAGTYVRRGANAALSGTVDDLRAFLKTGCDVGQLQDDALAVAHILYVASQNGDKRVVAAANAALNTLSAEAVRAFLDTGYAQAQVEDDALATATILVGAAKNGDVNVQEAGNDALNASTAEALSYFRWTGYRLAQAADDAIYISRMLLDPDISDAMVDAIRAVLDDGSPEALREFRTAGQYEVD